MIYEDAGHDDEKHVRHDDGEDDNAGVLLLMTVLVLDGGGDSG